MFRKEHYASRRIACVRKGVAIVRESVLLFLLPSCRYEALQGKNIQRQGVWVGLFACAS